MLQLNKKQGENKMNCIFCAIINGDIPSKKVYEDENVYAFLDINPQAPVHALVVPKAHIGSADEITAENSALIARVFEAAAAIAAEQKLEKGFRIVTNCGEDGGQTVGHIHFHMLAQRSLAWPPG